MHLINVHENADGVLVGECPNCHSDCLVDSEEDVELDCPMPDTLREAAEGLPEMLETAATWINACPFENAIPHAASLVTKAFEIQQALAAPDPVAEAREIIREVVGSGVAWTTQKYVEVQLSIALMDACRDWLKRNGGTK